MDAWKRRASPARGHGNGGFVVGFRLDGDTTHRAVGKLRELGIAEIRRGDLYTNDWAALKEYAQFDPDYLYGPGPLKVKEDWD